MRDEEGMSYAGMSDDRGMSYDVAMIDGGMSRVGYGWIE